MKFFSLLLLLPLLALTACDANEDEPVGEVTIVDLVVGTGPEAVEGSFVSFKYAGFLTDSTSLGVDSLEIAIGDGSVIEGLDRGLRGMREGGKRRLTVPPGLAFGRRGNSTIPPNSTIIFEIEMKRVGGSNGILIEEITVGTGEEATSGDAVEVTYAGTLVNGTVFDQGTFPFEIDSRGAIEGFNRGVKGMKVGGTRRVTIPPSLGYGAQPVEDAQGNILIPPFSTLIFDVTLLSVQK